MSETRHTPEPWSVEGVSDAVRIFVGKGRGKIILARLCPKQLPEDETWKNALLMGASPRLLEACRRALDALGEDRTPTDRRAAERFIHEAVRAAQLRSSER